jgi:hypothetical protein
MLGTGGIAWRSPILGAGGIAWRFPILGAGGMEENAAPLSPIISKAEIMIFFIEADNPFRIHLIFWKTLDRTIA